MIRRNVSERRPFVTSRSGSSPRIFRIRGFARRTSQRRDLIGFRAFARLSVLRSRNWLSRERRNATDGRGARWQGRRGDKGVVTLRRSRTTSHAHAGVRIDVGIRSCEAVRERLEEGHDLVLLRIGQAQLTNRHVKVVGNLGHRPAVYFFGLSCRAVPRSYREGVYVARIIEVYELLQALDVAVVEELLLEVRPWSLGRRTLWWRQGDVARRRRLHLAIRSWRKWCPLVIRAWPRAGTAS